MVGDRGLEESKRGETLGGRPREEARGGVNMAFVCREAGQCAEQPLIPSFPIEVVFPDPGFMLHRVILSGMCPPSNPAGPSREGGPLRNGDAQRCKAKEDGRLRAHTLPSLLQLYSGGPRGGGPQANNSRYHAGGILEPGLRTLHPLLHLLPPARPCDVALL